MRAHHHDVSFTESKPVGSITRTVDAMTAGSSRDRSARRSRRGGKPELRPFTLEVVDDDERFGTCGGVGGQARGGRPTPSGLLSWPWVTAWWRHWGALRRGLRPGDPRSSGPGPLFAAVDGAPCGRQATTAALPTPATTTHPARPADRRGGGPAGRPAGGHDADVGGAHRRDDARFTALLGTSWCGTPPDRDGGGPAVAASTPTSPPGSTWPSRPRSTRSAATSAG